MRGVRSMAHFGEGNCGNDENPEGGYGLGAWELARLLSRIAWAGLASKR